ncbi:LOW QUALITY PROTEIN: ubiquitin-protein ligase E3B-like [Rhipicephalus sanguineus]|uniref:LOW QUALITY PROTEIN: ubiquitin-protein ligase E3B-like n=1 Tax=Rhipicephalus sanguineus TaxID=34632 RepID=UPI001893AF99|nr:LOW QUALITY PROTEIN: ubiquitin-protein ligase E3B-like [Rhipicephalus sanguineus]
MFAGQPKSATKEQFLEQAKAARIERAQERRRDQAASVIQAVIRGFLLRQRLRKEFRREFDSVLRDGEGEDPDAPVATSALDVFLASRKFLFTFHPKVDKERFERLCRYIIASMDADTLQESYVSVALNKEHTVLWIQQLKGILGNCCGYLKEVRPECPQDAKSLMLHLHVLVTFTSTSSWKVLKDKTYEPLRPVLSQLCASVGSHLMGKGSLYGALQALLLRGLARAKPSLKRAPLVATINLALRPLLIGQFSEDLMNLFLLHILSVPALVHHLLNIAPEAVTLLNSHGLFRRSLDILVVEQNMRILFNALEGNYALCLLANLVHLAYLNIENLNSRLLDFVHVSTKLLESCQKYVVNKRSNLTHWHPILGWFAQSIDHGLHESLTFVKQQLQLLWCGPLVKVLFSPLAEMLAQNDNSNSSSSEAPTSQSPQPDVPASVLSSPASASASSLLKKALERASSGRTCSVQYRRLGSPEVTAVALTCALFETALASLTQLRLDILTGLCHHEWVLCQLWQLIRSVGPASGVRAFLDLLAFTTKPSGPEFRLLVLFCDCATHLVTILDDLELYEQQRPFTLDDLVAISAFLNTFVFRLVWNGLIDLKTVNTNQLFCSCHTLLMVLYKRDCRRSYTPPDHWLIKDVKVSTFMSDLEKGKKAAQVLLQKVPHIIPHKERVVLFRKYVTNEKTVLGLTESACALSQSTLITVHRTRIVEDGYQQLAMLPTQGLKGVIRVRFINEQGLDEAGIDQDGVFKEFLEETIKRVFDPSLNLFRATSEQRLYPSPTSYIHENHLSLFEFVGKMLGKAVYEGIVVDVPFASFFLSQLLGHQHSALYSSIDELPSLDADLYRSLTCVKHYEGDVQDLDLTFSLNEDCMGKLVTHELVPGGKAIPVTNENKISYMHLMAHFRMHSQIQEQTAAFLRGFRALVNPEWLTMFSTPELQRLIAGDNTPVDLQDLRRHTKYFGGFHNNHRLVNWLWDILERDFTSEEHHLFLKFVTSCSKPPLLGFAHLEPPFSIRCVEVSDDQDTGDTIGSVIRGFFTIRKKDPVNRLPTSSTCFNLLKLPNYQRKSTLRDKLRYAITSNTGFELS